MKNEILELLEKEDIWSALQKESDSLDIFSKAFFSDFNEDSLSSKKAITNFQHASAYFSNTIGQKVCCTILNVTNSEESVSVYSFWLVLAKQAFKDKNFEVSFSIISALNNSEICKIFGEKGLAHSLLEVSLLKDKAELDRTFSFEKNFKALRDHRNSLETPFYGPLLLLAKDIESLKVNIGRPPENKLLTADTAEKIKSDFRMLLGQRQDYSAEAVAYFETYNQPQDIASASAKLQNFLKLQQELLRLQQFLQTLQEKNYKTTEKESPLNDCKTVKEFCFEVSVCVGNLSFTPLMRNQLIELLNHSEQLYFKEKICPNSGQVRMRDIREYALHGGEFGYVGSQSTLLPNQKDMANKKFFKHVYRDRVAPPSMIFHNQSQVEKAARAAETLPSHDH
ncbi:RasGEF domain protein [Piscirickettsia salmonis]|uniref:RasGEF domain protein n=1 Tax=Piscirickettsia salmonis TaxID=1238 RepID=A0A1L6TCP6_PISSA|nr:RasGEF domain-containing protein [Piscirickettsia salmonis]AKP74250.1 rasGEF domain protein [Piscirickettsia salmonis LF-89 = ATCC VR-1361]ALB23157.1 rasGEF domain protein [Piscirickettsia salmonis]ALY03085.1 rasGEF domain protein [Piscirickettsia salmonis]AMA42643.1 rasGEF domain protein [Piscirickettsia salmonis]AOS35113.1 rasGEF domain protein [Piscirickettsia salmonis]